eukprot:CAMPEP_0174245890 /NCGR_PEP_ID=MMETSP0417-20130205/41098_1 /TAXON_ID=242541 /ORGANISM="Mayorella sp, Strain BSH-02190019" /LENGTH=247 /DNA_ID=CAMNT_0015325715 /DNA_START=40 /DNA_END=779 /DNA_ORIENTATION=-
MTDSSVSIFGKRSASTPVDFVPLCEEQDKHCPSSTRKLLLSMAARPDCGPSIFGKRDHTEEERTQQQQHGSACTTTASVYGEEAQKRTRQLDAATQQHVDPIFRRVVLWLFENQRCLPRTGSAFRNAIQSQCSRQVQVDPLVILYHLLFNGVLTLKLAGGHEMIQLAEQPHKPVDQFVGIVPTGSAGTESTIVGGLAGSAFSDDFRLALCRAVQWVSQHGDLRAGRCFRKLCFLRQLLDVCRIRRQV